MQEKMPKMTQSGAPPYVAMVHPNYRSAAGITYDASSMLQDTAVAADEVAKK